MPWLASILVLVASTTPFFIANGSSARAEIQFEDTTAKANINYTGPTWSSAWADANGDGLVDIFVSNHGTTRGRYPSLYINDGFGLFSDQAQGSFSQIERDMHGAAWADFDNDGDQDLLIVSGGGRGQSKLLGSPNPVGDNVLWVNSSSGFQDVSQDWNLKDSFGRGRMPVWMDVDRDGLLDVFLAKAADESAQDYIYLQRNDSFQACDQRLENFPTDFNITNAQLLKLFEDGKNYLVLGSNKPFRTIYRQLENCRFEPVDLPAPGLSNVSGTGDMLIADFTGNLAPEIFIATDVSSLPSFVNTEKSLFIDTFLDESISRLQFRTDAQSVAFRFNPISFDYWSSDRIFIGKSGAHPIKRPFRLATRTPEHEGLFDLTNVEAGIAVGFNKDLDAWQMEMKSPDRRRLFRMDIRASSPITFDASSTVVPRGQSSARPAKLVKIDPNGFSDLSNLLPSEEIGGCHTATYADFDNDMDVDLFVGCNTAPGGGPNIIYENQSGQGFVMSNVGDAEAGKRSGWINAVSHGDYDDDGFIDVFITNGSGDGRVPYGHHQLLRNLGNNNKWIRFDLKGTESPKNAYGARVFLVAGGRTQMRYFNGGLRRAAQDQPVVHFGLAQHKRVDRVVVEWPSTLLEAFSVQGVNRTETLVEGSGTAVGSGVIVLSRESVLAGEEVTLLALFNDAVEIESIAWLIDSSDLANASRRISHRFWWAGDYQIDVRAQIAGGPELRISRSVTVSRRPLMEWLREYLKELF